MSACFENSRADASGTSLDSRFLSAGQVVLCCIDGEAAVDVVVTPVKFKPGTWTLSDRLGRPLGTITEAPPSLFVINADRNSGLFKMATASFPSLDSVMSGIANHMKGECQLSSDDE
jgi:hypothetical protein